MTQPQPLSAGGVVGSGAPASLPAQEQWLCSGCRVSVMSPGDREGHIMIYPMGAVWLANLL